MECEIDPQCVVDFDHHSHEAKNSGEVWGELRHGCPVAAEALVRISDAERGLLLPHSFLEVAEETGLLIAMDEDVLADAVEQASNWHLAVPPLVAATRRLSRSDPMRTGH